MGVHHEFKIHHLHLDALFRDAMEVLRAAEALFASLSPEQLTWKSNRKVWSIYECFDHLLVTNSLYLPRIEEAIRRNVVAGEVNPAPFKPSWFGRKFVESMRPGSRVKVRTFKIFKPRSGFAGPAIVQEFMEQQQQLLNLIRQADRCDINGAKISSPANRFIRLSVGEALSMLVAHEQRHLLQAQNVQLHAQFPEFQA